MKFFAPEVVQTSAMDCGPASLKALLAGFDVNVSYGRLREACQTDVDGTSIDTLEEIANQLGLMAEQVMIPADHLLVPSAQSLPAIVVIVLPNGLTHFVVVWRTFGRWVQVMDPASGRRWQTRKQLIQELYRHQFPVPAEGWREYAGSDDFIVPLQERMGKIGRPTAQITTDLQQATTDPSWHTLATFDAATRFVQSLIDTQSIRSGRAASTLLTNLAQETLHYLQNREEPDSRFDEQCPIPAAYWSV